MFKILYEAGDKLEDRVRVFLSHYPIAYAFSGGVGVVIFWRGVWHTADYLMGLWTVRAAGLSSIDMNLGVWWDGPLSFLAGSALLLMTGVFVSNFIGNEIIISGLRGEKKLAERTEKEVRSEEDRLALIRDRVGDMHGQLAAIKNELDEALRNNRAKGQL